MKLFRQIKRMLTVVLTVCFVLLTTVGFAQQQKADSLRKLMNRDPKNSKIIFQFFDALKKVSPDSAAHFVNDLLIKGEDKNDSLRIAEAYYLKAVTLVDAGNLAECVSLYRKAYQYTKERKDSSGMVLNAAISKSLGGALANIGKFAEAEPFLEHSRQIFQFYKDSIALATTLVSYGQLEKDLGKYDQGLSLLFNGLEIAKRKKDDKLTGRMLNNIANIYNGQRKYQDAINFYEQSIEYKQKTGSTADIGNSYGNIGVSYYSLKNYSKALDYYRKSLLIKTQFNDKKGAASTVNNIGLLYLDQQKDDSAEIYLLRALKMRTEMQDEGSVASSETSLVILYVRTGRCEKALPYVKHAVTVLEKNGALENLERIYEYSAQVYNCLGKYKEAYEYGQKYIGVHDSILAITNLQQSEEMKAKYDAAEQDEKIKNFESEKKQSELKQAADEAERKQNQYLVIGIGIIGIIIGISSFLRQREAKKSRVVLENAYNEIETKNKNITDSIRYARRIQQSILPEAENFKRLFKNSFVLYKPKDIVSGDFWWIHETPDKETVIAIADCTGHGVPGAFMSVMGTDILSQMTKNKNIITCSSALNFLDNGVRQQLKQTGGDDESRDGMDIAIALIDWKNKKMQFAGALRPLLLVRDGKLLEFSGARYSIGGAYSGEKEFRDHDIELQSGDMLYLFTDGYGDQFGGPKGKKFKSARLKELLISISHLSSEEQSAKLEHALNEWKGNHEQVDDICIAGIRI